MSISMSRLKKTAVATVLAASAAIAGLNALPAHASTLTDTIAATANGQRGSGPCALGGNGYVNPDSPTHYSCAAGVAAESWCADFAAWAWGQAGVPNDSAITAGANSFYDYGQKHGTWSTTPHVGDAVYFDSSLKSGVDGHVAVVTAVNSNGTFTEVGGNENGVVGPGNTFNSTPNTQVVWQNNDNGTMVNVYVMGFASPAAAPSSTTQGRVDFNGDGKDDLFGIDGTGNDHAYLSDGTGHVGNALGNLPGWNGYSQVAVGDFDNSGHASVMAIQDSTGTLYFYKGNGDGTVQNGVQAGYGFTGYTHLVAGHFFNSGHLDLAAITPSGQLAMFPGNGTGAIGNATVTGSGWSGFTRIITGDFNGDNTDDLLAIDSSGAAHTYLGNGAGSVSNGVAAGYGWQGYSNVVAGDFNGDGKADIMAINDSTGNLYFYKGNGDGTVQNGVQVGYGFTGYTHLIAGHFMGTANLDIAAITPGGQLAIDAGDGTGHVGNAVLTGSGWNTITRLY